MSQRDFLARHGVVRNSIKEDLLHFALPAIVIFTVGIVFCARDGMVELLPTAWRLVRDPQSLFSLSRYEIAGMVLFFCGLSIAVAAQVTLRRFYSGTLVIKEGHRLIRHGLYRITRHPIYFGVLMACVGLATYPSSWIGLLIMSALIPVFLGRIKIEERLLITEFGDEYRTYQASTSKLVPFIY